MVSNPFANRLATNAAEKNSAAPNPFAKKLVFNKAPAVEAETTEISAKVEESIAQTGTDAVAENNSATETSNVEEITESADIISEDNVIPGETIDNPFVKPEIPDPIPEDSIETTETTVDTETVTEEIVISDITPDTIDAAEEIVSEENTETEQPKKRRKRKSTATNEDSVVATDTTNTVNTPITLDQIKHNSTIPFSKAIEAFCSIAVDEEWLEFKNDIEKVYNNITIPTDLNSAMMLNIICQLSNLRNRIWAQHQYYKNQYDAISSREPEGIIERIKRLYIDDTASNDLQRKRAGIMACINYKTKDGEIVNLYDLFDEVRARYYFLNSIMSNIDFQKNLLITASSALKLENELAGE